MQTVLELLEAAQKNGLSLGLTALQWQAAQSGTSEDSLRAKMRERLNEGRA